MLATGSFDASVGIWRRYDDGGMGDGKIGAAKDVLSGVDFEGRDRDIQSGLMGNGGGENAEEEEEEEWRFAIVLDGHESEVKSVAWSAGGNLLATCSRDKSVWIWEEMAGDDDYETVAVMQEHEGDVKCVAWHPSEELLASASYDDEVRLWREDVDDWGCCGVLRGHEGTVWFVAWEGRAIFGGVHDGDGLGGEKAGKEKWLERRQRSGPRLLSCSDDLSIRVWRRRPKEKVQQSRLSIIKSAGSEEDWVEEARLPVVHGRPVYAVAWGKGGRVVSTGGDGRVVVYEERWRRGGGGDGDMVGKLEEATGEDGVGEAKGAEGPIIQEVIEESPHIPNGQLQQQLQEAQQQQQQQPAPETQDQSLPEIQPAPTEWVVVAQLEAAHGVFEINHVAWASRRRARNAHDGNGNGDNGKGSSSGKAEQEQEQEEQEEELIITTGDDGTVKVWCLEG